MHIEGSIEPQLMLDLAARNGLKLRWNTAEALRGAYRFQNLQSFLDLYFEGCKVLVTERDFHDVTRAYLRRAHEDGVIRAEMFIGPQSFTERGTPIEALMSGVLGAMEEARREHRMSVGVMISAHRQRTEPDAMAMLDQVIPWKDRIVGIGMGGAGQPTLQVRPLFPSRRQRGFTASRARPSMLARKAPPPTCASLR